MLVVPMHLCLASGARWPGTYRQGRAEPLVERRLLAEHGWAHQRSSCTPSSPPHVEHPCPGHRYRATAVGKGGAQLLLLLLAVSNCSSRWCTHAHGGRSQLHSHRASPLLGSRISSRDLCAADSYASIRLSPSLSFRGPMWCPRRPVPHSHTSHNAAATITLARVPAAQC